MPKKSAYQEIEDAIINDGGRGYATAGKLNAKGHGFEVALWVLRGGRPIMLQKTGRGETGEEGVEVYAPLTDDMTIVGTIRAMEKYRDRPRRDAEVPDTILADVADALAAFWERIAVSHPECKTGDLSPTAVCAFEEAAANAVQQWVETNRR